MFNWTPTSAGFMAERNGQTVGFVTARDDGSVVWQVTAVSMKWIGKGRGEARSIASAKAALRRAWVRWLNAYGLGELSRTTPGEGGPA